MLAWYQDMPIVTGLKDEPPDELFSAWPDGALAPWHHYLTRCPVEISEVMNVAQTLPLDIEKTDQGPQLLAILDAKRTRSKIFSESGAWVAGYKPRALRLLPFVATGSGHIAGLNCVNGPGDVSREKSIQGYTRRTLEDHVKRLKITNEHIQKLINRKFLEISDSGKYKSGSRILDGVGSIKVEADELRILYFMTAIIFARRNFRESTDADRFRINGRPSFFGAEGKDEMRFLHHGSNISFSAL